MCSMTIIIGLLYSERREIPNNKYTYKIVHSYNINLTFITGAILKIHIMAKSTIFYIGDRSECLLMDSLSGRRPWRPVHRGVYDLFSYIVLTYLYEYMSATIIS